MAHQLTLPNPSRPPSSYSHNNNAPSAAASTTTSDLDDDDDDDPNSPLPFPAALARSDFLAPTFDAAAYLSALHTGGPASRHQTLEDLRAELRDRSAAISAELLELVNANYTAFLELGDELKGGEERVEDVRVALLGFKRVVEELRRGVRERRAEVGGANGELAGVKGAVEVGRRMLELDERVGGLEGSDDDDDENEDEDEGVGFGSSSPGKLAALAREYVLVEQIADSIGRDMPFVKKMEKRMARCRNTILLDLSTALKEARKAGPKGQARVLKYLGIYRVLDAQADAIKVLKQK
ncbi:hypothetical protein NEMBOFW57_005524 [Staphylotrichum longicolle]|uniref:Conserved oligomeric Golgi complex subunit 2 n=1 Tax=Staphylotrichum longicolle TaxID=669026 RepID=A0AAD4EXH6_9PEZI|nr:hypothetical protein NEMBOFW57_005524 [Staphylotrichum longicolle]